MNIEALKCLIDLCVEHSYISYHYYPNATNMFTLFLYQFQVPVVIRKYMHPINISLFSK